jgi:stage II sporulation protein D
VIGSRADFLGAATAALFTGGLDVWSTPAPATRIRILVSADRGADTPQPFDAQTFTFGGTRYRGAPAIVRLPDGREAVIANLDVDTYLYGVVGLEASPGWPATALEAQSIVARTYALEHRTLSRPYDVTMTESDQRYGGIPAESPACVAAVDATRAIRLAYAGGPASVFYASCCGGHTEDAADLWGHAELPYVRGVVCRTCTASPDFRWERAIPLARISALLGPRLGGAITGFALGPADRSGRPRSIDVLAGGTTLTLATAAFRALLGADVIRSTWIRRIEIDSTQAVAQAVIEGSGRGHGVGLCQWGARGMSVAGASVAQILAYYFPGTVLARG